MTKTTHIRSLLLLTIHSSAAFFHAVIPSKYSAATSLSGEARFDSDDSSSLTAVDDDSSGNNPTMIPRGTFEETIEWQDSFLRNGLADFVPPASIFMQCLVVGGADHPNLPFLWEPDVVASPTLLGSTTVQAAESFTNKDTTAGVSDHELPDTEDLEVAIAKVLKEERKNDQMNHTPNRKPQRYDCILDQGLMNDILLNGADDAAVLDLCIKASLAIREHGIYVFVTGRLSELMKAQLQEIGQSVGLDWQFDLDGISDKDVSVSVARKYCTDAMPSVGKLAI